MSPTTLAPGARPVAIPADGRMLPGTLAWPTHPAGFVLFSQESGTSRSGQPTLAVAGRLREAGLGTLLLDASPGDDCAFEVDRLTRGLLAAAEWLANQAEAAGLSLGLLGIRDGAAPSLRVAAGAATPIGAVVSSDGRPELATAVLDRVRAPTLLLVGARDPEVLELNRQAYRRLGGPKRLVVMPGGGLEEAGALERAADWTAEWFVFHLALERAWRAARGVEPRSTGRAERYDQQRQAGVPHQLGGNAAEQRAVHPGEAVGSHHQAVRPSGAGDLAKPAGDVPAPDHLPGRRETLGFELARETG
jgi:putative phosphoribosyl transferase